MADRDNGDHRVLVVHDDDGHCHAFDAENPKVWIGLAFECLSLDWLTLEQLQEVIGMVGQGKFRDVHSFLDNRDCLGCDFHYAAVRDEWTKGLRSNVNGGVR